MQNSRQTRTLERGFETREEGGAKIIEGYFAVFGSPYEICPGITEQIAPEAFDGALGGDVRALIDHDTHLVVGRTLSGTLNLQVDQTGLFGSIVINPEDSDALNAYARVKRRDVTQASFGFDILEEEHETRADGSMLVTIKKLKLYEVSICTFPAYAATELHARAKDIKAARVRAHEIYKTGLKERMKNAWH